MATNRQLGQQARRRRERQQNSIQQCQVSAIPISLPALASPITLTRSQSEQPGHQFQRRQLMQERLLQTNPVPLQAQINTNSVSMNLHLAQQARRTRELLQSQQELPIACRPLPPHPATVPSLHHRLGPCNVPCRLCRADHWIEERVQGSAKYAPRFATCCESGAIMMERFQDPPQPLFSLLMDTTPGMFPLLN